MNSKPRHPLEASLVLHLGKLGPMSLRERAEEGIREDWGNRRKKKFLLGYFLEVGRIKMIK